MIQKEGGQNSPEEGGDASQTTLQGMGLDYITLMPGCTRCTTEVNTYGDGPDVE